LKGTCCGSLQDQSGGWLQVASHHDFQGVEHLPHVRQDLSLIVGLDEAHDHKGSLSPSELRTARHGEVEEEG